MVFPSSAVDLLNFNGAALFQVRKALIGESIPAPPAALQWGRTFSSAESLPESPSTCIEGPLQWGRTFSSAESCGVICISGSSSKTSMGPHFFKCGKLCIIFCFTNNCMTYFNGAALFQVRKVGDVPEIAKYPRGTSMGPHFFKCGKESPHELVGGCEETSMGPHFFKCGKIMAVIRTPPNE